MRKLIGHIGIDSGQVMVCDPCYIDSEWKKEEFDMDSENPAKHNFSYNACAKATIGKERYGKLKFKSGHDGVAVVSSTGFGDGYYPVFANVDEDGRVMSLTVMFFSEDGDEWYDDDD